MAPPLVHAARNVGLIAVILFLPLADRVAANDYMFGGSSGAQFLTVSTDLGDVILSTEDNPVSDYLDQGWWSETDGNVDSNDNYFAGEFGDNYYRNFFSFDTSSLAGRTIFGAVFEPFAAYIFTASDGMTYTIYDVSTPVAELNFNEGTNSAIFADLGSGVSYGNQFILAAAAFTNLSVSLNAAGIADLQTAVDEGQYFSIGGTAVPSAAIPEPSSIVLLAMGMGASWRYGRRSRRYAGVANSEFRTAW